MIFKTKTQQRDSMNEAHKMGFVKVSTILDDARSCRDTLMQTGRWNGNWFILPKNCFSFQWVFYKRARALFCACVSYNNFPRICRIRCMDCVRRVHQSINERSAVSFRLFSMVFISILWQSLNGQIAIFTFKLCIFGSHCKHLEDYTRVIQSQKHSSLTSQRFLSQFGFSLAQNCFGHWSAWKCCGYHDLQSPLERHYWFYSWNVLICLFINRSQLEPANCVVINKLLQFLRAPPTKRVLVWQNRTNYRFQFGTQL